MQLTVLSALLHSNVTDLKGNIMNLH